MTTKPLNQPKVNLRVKTAEMTQITTSQNSKRVLLNATDPFAFQDFTQNKDT